MTEINEDQTAHMSPEQAAEMQKNQCIFCQIISGKVASKRIYEDEKCVGLLDINPANPGHVILMPKEHYSIMPLMPEEEIKHLFRTAKNISKAQIRTLQTGGTTIFAANGAVAGQKAPHFMIHIIPRKKNDGITAFTLPKNEIGDEDQEKLRRAIKKKVNQRFGLPDRDDAEQQPEPVHIEAPEEPEEIEAEPEAEMEPMNIEAPEEPEDDGQEEDEPEVEPVNIDAPEEPEEEQAEEDDEEERKMFDIPPPEPHEDEFEKHQAEESTKPKKKIDLDAISELFR